MTNRIFHPVFNHDREKRFLLYHVDWFGTQHTFYAVKLRDSIATHERAGLDDARIGPSTSEQRRFQNRRPRVDRPVISAPVSESLRVRKVEAICSFVGRRTRLWRNSTKTVSVLRRRIQLLDWTIETVNRQVGALRLSTVGLGGGAIGR
uniref:Uncharacterized protein n=1 Tax=Plectus sambesii TaxID=2011161 RepID=A0A914VLG2_9BILA